MRFHRSILPCTALLLSLICAPAQAGSAYFSLGLQGSQTLESSDIVESDGGGLELSLGYFLTPRWSLEIAGMATNFDSKYTDLNGNLLGVSLNTRFSPMPRERFQPYLKGGIGAYFLSEDGVDSGLSGPGLNLGIGSELFLVPGVSIGAEATWRYILYTDEYYYDDCCGDTDYYPLDDHLDGTTFSAGITLNYHFR